MADIDCVLIVTNHSVIDYQMLADHAPLIVDTRNAMRDIAFVVATEMRVA